MPTSQVLVILITNPFFSFLILASPAALPAAASLLDPELIFKVFRGVSELHPII